MILSVRGRISPSALIVFLLGFVLAQAQAAWIGAGTAGGDPAATNFNDAANWQGSAINGDFRTVISNVTIRLTADYTATNGMDFAEQDKSFTRHITLTGTNSLTLSGLAPGYTNTLPRNIMLPSNDNSTVTLGRGLTVNIPGTCNIRGNSSLFVDARVTGPGKMTSYFYGGVPYVILRNDANTFASGFDEDAGYIYFSSVNASKTAPSAIGTNSTSLSLNNGPAFYIGCRDGNTDRPFAFLNGGVSVFNSSGSGRLNLKGTVSIGGAVHTCLTLGGTSAGEGSLSAALPNNSASWFTRIVKAHSGTWRLTGANTFTGWTNNTYHVSISGGTLIADYTNDVAGAGSNRVFLAGRTVYYSDGKLLILGKTGAGNTTWQALGTNAIENNSFDVLSLDGNGGDGTTVSLGELVIPYEYSFLRMERAGAATIRLTNALSSGTVRLINGMAMGYNGSRANVLMKDPDGRVGFATQNGTFDFARHTNTLALTADNSSTTDHVALASDLTRTANLSFSTLSIDATANPVTVDMGGHVFQTNSSGIGRGLVINGINPVTIRGGTHGAQPSTLLYNYGTGKFAWELTNSASCTLVSAGSGLTEITQPVLANLYIAEGVTRLTSARNYAEGSLYVYANGVLEIGADLNGATAGDFTRSTGSGAGQIWFGAGGGFSAYGTNRTVNLGGSGITVGWQQDGKPLIFSSPYADATLIFQNPIELSARVREIRVNNGSSAIDASLTGKISGGKYSAIVKSGSGTLELTGPQSYRGDMSVIGGGLRLGANGVFAGGTNALVLSGARLDAGTYANAFDTLELLADSVVETGDGSAALSFADSSSKLWTGTLTVNGRLAATTLRFGTGATGLAAAQVQAITNRGRPVYLDAQGYLRQKPAGTLLRVL